MKSIISQTDKLIVVGETYIKFDYIYNQFNQEKLANILIPLINSNRVSEALKKNQFSVSIEFTEGSLKVKVFYLSLTILNLVNNYGSFREGIDRIVNDFRNVSSYIIIAVNNEPDINEIDILRNERRTGLPGRIQDIYIRIDHLEKQLPELSNNQIEEELNSIKHQIANILPLMEENEKESFIEELDNKYKQDLPDPQETKVNYLVNRYALKPDNRMKLTNY